MPPETLSSLRHQPKQLRGMAKVDQILRCAQVLFAEVGYESATTNALAAKAEISIGSLYQFFPNKEAILEALTQQYLAEARNILAATLAAAQQNDVDQVIEDLIRSLIDLHQRQPFFVQCLAGSRVSPTVAHAAKELRDTVTHELADFLAGLSAPVDEATSRLRAEITVDGLGALLHTILIARGDKREIAIREGCILMGCYLSPIMAGER